MSKKRRLRRERAFELERAGELDHRLDVIRVVLDRLLEQRDPAIHRIALGQAQVHHPAGERLVGFERLGPGVGNRRQILLRDVHFETRGQLGHELVLQLEQLFDSTVHLHGRELPAGGDFDPLRGDADAIAQALIRAAHRDRGAEPATKLHGLAIVDAASELAETALQLEDLLAGHDRHRLDPREVRGQRFGNALADPVVGGVAGDVGEVQHGDDRCRRGLGRLHRRHWHR